MHRVSEEGVGPCMASRTVSFPFCFPVDQDITTKKILANLSIYQYRASGNRKYMPHSNRPTPRSS